MQDIHIHIHAGVDPEAARAAIEAARALNGSSAEPAAVEAAPPVDEEKYQRYVERAYTESDGSAKPLLEFLADNPGRDIPFTEISKALGYATNRSLPGLLGAFGRRAKHRYEGIKPFKAFQIEGWWHAHMSPETAEIINSLR